MQNLTMSATVTILGGIRSKVFVLGIIILMVLMIFMENTFRKVQIPQPVSTSRDLEIYKSKRYNIPVVANKVHTTTTDEAIDGPRKQNPGQHESSGNKLHKTSLTKFGRGFDVSPPYWSRITQVCEEINFLNSNSTALTNMSATKVNSFSFQPNGVLTMSIQTYDFTNRPKVYGGDAILAWATEENGDGKAAAKIVDNNDGTYSVRVLMFWTGLTRVNFKLVSSAENACNFFSDWIKYGKNASARKRNNYSFVGSFVNGDIQEWTECGPLARLYMGEEICNFTSLNGGSAWFCIKPKHDSLSCLNIEWFKTGHLQQNISEDIRTGWTISEDQAFQSVSLTVRSHFKRTAKLLCKDRKPIESWIESRPSGFWMNDKWYFANCDSKLQHDFLEYRKCLKNKNIYFVGDSTVRQYANYFLTEILEIRNTNQIFDASKIYHTNNIARNHNISLIFLRHEMPLQNLRGFTSAGITSVPQILRYIANSSNDEDPIILMVTYNAHFSIYPPEVFRDRIRHLSKSIEVLLQMKPNAKIFFKSTYPTYKDLKAFSVNIWMTFHEILLEEFSFIMDRVVLLDIWSIVVAHEEADLHPQGKAFTSEIQLFISYLC